MPILGILCSLFAIIKIKERSVDFSVFGKNYQPKVLIVHEFYSYTFKVSALSF